LDRSVPSDYRFAPPLVVRFFGLVLVCLGLVTARLIARSQLVEADGRLRLP